MGMHQYSLVQVQPSSTVQSIFGILVLETVMTQKLRPSVVILVTDTGPLVEDEVFIDTYQYWFCS